MKSKNNIAVSEGAFLPTGLNDKPLLGAATSFNKMKLIPLTKGLFAKVDEEDFEYLSQFKWQVMRCSTSLYASRHLRGAGVDTKILMHREILNPQKGLVVDHINYDGLDNRRSNMRICTKSGNNKNRRKAANCTSQYLGVYFHRHTKKWMAQSNWMRKHIYIGIYNTEEEAAMAYNEVALKQAGEFAILNIITQTYKQQSLNI